jgi:hypothetical protein
MVQASCEKRARVETLQNSGSRWEKLAKSPYLMAKSPNIAMLIALFDGIAMILS